MTAMQPMRYGMIDGWRGSFIGGIHRTPDGARASDRNINLDPARAYGSWPRLQRGA